MLLICLKYFLIFSYMCFACTGEARKPPLLAKTIIIKATRLPVASVLSPAVDYLTAEKIAMLQFERINDILQQEPGVQVVQSGPLGQVSSVFFRGTNSNHLLVRLDGMRANPPDSASGSFDFSDLTTQGVGTVEIIRGAVSSLYGTDAVGGVLNIQSEQGKGPLRKTVAIEGGTNPSQSLKASIQGEHQKINFALTAYTFHTPGIVGKPEYLQKLSGSYPRLPYSLRLLNFRGGSQVNDRTEITLFSRFNDAFLLYQEELRAVAQSRRQILNRVQIDHKSGEGWVHQGGIGLLSTFSESDKYKPTFSTSQGQRIVADWHQKITLHRFYALQLTLEGEQERFHSHYADASSTAQSQQLGIGVLQRWTPWPHLVFETALRQDWSRQFSTSPCYRLAMNKKFPDLKTEFFLSYGTAFKAPPLFRLYGKTAFYQGNKDLKPEQVESYEIGIKHFLSSKSHLTVIYFHNNLRQLIEYDLASHQDINIARARTKGIEAILNVGLTPYIKGEVNHTLTLTRNEITGQALIRRPHHKTFLRVLYHYGKGQLIAEWEIMGKRLDVQPYLPFKKVERGVSHTVTLKLNYEIQPGWTVSMRIENLLNQKREEPLGYCQARMTGYVGLKATF